MNQMKYSPNHSIPLTEASLHVPAFGNQLRLNVLQIKAVALKYIKLFGNLIFMAKISIMLYQPTVISEINLILDISG